MNETNFTNFTCDEDDENVHIHALIYFIYFLISSVAALGNGVICYIIISSSRMRTVTNYFIMNLAIGDLLIAMLCGPFSSVAYLKQYWPFGSFLCLIVSYFQAIAVFVSSYTLVAISLDRYVAIVWPLRPRMSKKIAMGIIFAVWILSCLGGAPILMVSTMDQPNDTYFQQCDRYICTEKWPFEDGQYWYSQSLTLFQYVIPVSVFIFAYTSIAAVIWCHRVPGEAENCRDQRIARSKRKTVRMMVAVVLVYSICWLPFNVYWIVNSEIENRNVKKYLFYTVHALATSHACYNPIIYCYMNSRFRAGILSTLPCCRKCIASLSKRSKSSTSLPLTSLEGTDTTLLNRDNTCTTYISMRRQNGSRISKPNNHHQHHQVPVRSASMMRSTIAGNQCNYRKSVRYPNNVVENQI
nr:RYamide receptor-like isoform X1 [Onthophagus taurus]